MSKQANIKNRILRILLSGGFILVSAAYAFWQHAVQVAGAAPAIPVHQLAALPAPPQQQAAVSRIDASEPAAPAAAEKPAEAAPENAPRPAAPPPEIAPQTEPAAPPPVAAAPEPAPAQVASAAPMVTIAPPEPAPEKRSAYTDGEFTGKSAYTSWGDVQVKVVVKNGAVAEVDPLDYPNHRRRSIEINDWAIPRLEQEAVSVQTGEIDLVSQATVTSYGYQESLADALAQAKKQ